MLAATQQTATSWVEGGAIPQAGRMLVSFLEAQGRRAAQIAGAE